IIFITINEIKSQALHCQPGDTSCQRCSSSCNSVQPSHLPECCEAFNVCCDHYLSACKQCSQIAAHDVFFPEYCCASFTACCDKVTTINVSPTTKRPKPKDSQIGENAILSVVSNDQETLSDTLRGHKSRKESSSHDISRVPSNVGTAALGEVDLTPQVSQPKPRGRGRGSSRGGNQASENVRPSQRPSNLDSQQTAKVFI
ncbi:hypothetical protein Anas_06723, partial [Armadillidium nasatum]